MLPLSDDRFRVPIVVAAFQKMQDEVHEAEATVHEEMKTDSKHRTTTGPQPLRGLCSIGRSPPSHEAIEAAGKVLKYSE